MPSSFVEPNGKKIAFYRLGLYGQDEWHARCFARLTGPFESVSHDPSEPYNQAILINQRQAFEKLNTLLWSPRLSFAWQPAGVSHSTVLSGGIGIFFDPLPAALINLTSANPPVVNSFTIFADNLTPTEKTSLFKTASASNTAFLSGFAAGQTLAQIQATISSFYPPGFSPPAMSVPARNMFSPQYQKWSLELQQAFGASTSATLGYYGNHGIHEQALNPSANAFGFGSFPAAPCSSPAVPPCADPRFSQVTEITTAAVSNYNGVIASFQHHFSRLTHGVLQANYVYG